MPQKSKQLEAMLEGVIAATPGKAPKQSSSARPAPSQAADQPSGPSEAFTPSITAERLEEERESFDCPVLVKRHLARLAVDQPDLSVRGLYLQAVAKVYGIEIPYQILRDRRRRPKHSK